MPERVEGLDGRRVGASGLNAPTRWSLLALETKGEPESVQGQPEVVDEA
jgi:hypothetical protein